MTALPLNPYDNNYVTSRLINQQLTDNQLDLILSGNVEAETTPKVVLDGTGRASLQGSVSITVGSPVANLKILDLPAKLIPQQDYNFPVCVLRAGAYFNNAVKIESSGLFIEGVTVTTAGNYASFPTLTFVGEGEGATAAPYMKIISASPVTAQSGAGSYAPVDVLEVVGGEGEAGRLDVTHTKVQSATVASAGTGGTPGTQTVTGTTGTGTKFQASVTVSGGGAITSVNSITVAGDYTVNPTSLTAEPVTGGGLTGAQLNIKMGVLTVVPNTLDGAYVDTLPTNPVSTTAITGTGTGATFNLLYGLDEIVVTNPGSGYTEDTTLSITGGGGSGGGAATVQVGTETSGTLTLINAPNENDVLSLDGINFLVEPYR